MRKTNKFGSLLIDTAIAVLYSVILIAMILGILFFAGNTREFIYMNF